MGDILPIHSGILLEEPEVATKTSYHRFSIGTMQIVHHAAFTLEAASVDVEKSHRVAFLEPFVLAFRSQFVDMTCPFMAERERFSQGGHADSHQVRVTEGGRSHLDEDLIWPGLWNREGVDHGLVLLGVPLCRLHRHASRTHPDLFEPQGWSVLGQGCIKK